MKTTKTFLNRKKISLFVVSAVVFCLLSVMLTQARELHSSSSNTDQDLLRFLTKVESEALLQVQPWMFNFNTQAVDKVFHPKIINVQESEFTPEPELIVEIWMEDLKSWSQHNYYAAK